VHVLVLPHRVGVQRDEVEFLDQWPQLFCTDVVFAERHRLRDRVPDAADVPDHPLDRHEVVRPVDGRLVAHGNREDDVVVVPRERDQAFDLGVVLRDVGFQLRFAVGAAQGRRSCSFRPRGARRA